MLILPTTLTTANWTQSDYAMYLDNIGRSLTLSPPIPLHFAMLVQPTISTAQAYARAVLGVVFCLCPSVRLSVTRVDCDKTK